MEGLDNHYKNISIVKTVHTCLDQQKLQFKKKSGEAMHAITSVLGFVFMFVVQLEAAACNCNFTVV